MTVSLPKPPTKTTQPTAASTVKAKANYRGEKKGRSAGKGKQITLQGTGNNRYKNLVPSQLDGVTIPQAAQHCSRAAVWFGVRKLQPWLMQVQVLTEQSQSIVDRPGSKCSLLRKENLCT